ncbi:MAG: hypothetical protein P8099_12910 [Gemmatimonadota bacterium]|jgi:hypothetical protein
MMRATRMGVVMLVLGSMTACASMPAGSKSSSQRDRLTRQEIMSVNVSSLYDVVSRLRPQWLEVEKRGNQSFGLQTNIVVFQNQTYLGNVDVLRQFSPESAYELDWLDGSTASNTLPGLGSQHVAGAIVIKTAAGGS